MGNLIGLDIGAVSFKLAAIGDPPDEPAFRSFADDSTDFFRAPFPYHSLFATRPRPLSYYRRTEGNHCQPVTDLLEEFHAHIPLD